MGSGGAPFVRYQNRDTFEVKLAWQETGQPWEKQIVDQEFDFAEANNLAFDSVMQPGVLTYNSLNHSGFLSRHDGAKWFRNTPGNSRRIFRHNRPGF